MACAEVRHRGACLPGALFLLQEVCEEFNADALSRRPDLSAGLMDNDSPDATHTLMHTGSQTVMDNDPSSVCAIETPTSTMVPVKELSLCTGR